MQPQIQSRLHEFASSRRFIGNKGPLCVALHLTRHAIDFGLPLDPAKLITKGKGQVLGLGKGAVQRILNAHGISKTLASEGGRTSRSSISNMQEYATLLNELAHMPGFSLAAVEAWWIERVRDYFDSSPIKLRADNGTSLKVCLLSLFDEAKRRQTESRGSTVLGAVMQHLVGAKLETLYPSQKIHHSGYSVADSPTGRSGDFQIGDCVIHVTTHPGDLLLQKCSANLDGGLRPLIISTNSGAAHAEALADEIGLGRRIEVLDVMQFLVGNMLEWTEFDGNRRKEVLGDLVRRYNAIVETCETDPSLKIELA